MESDTFLLGEGYTYGVQLDLCKLHLQVSHFGGGGGSSDYPWTPEGVCFLQRWEWRLQQKTDPLLKG